MDSDGQLRAVEDSAVCIQKAVDGKALGASVGEAPFLHRFQLHAFRVRHKYNVLFRLASWGMIFYPIVFPSINVVLHLLQLIKLYAIVLICQLF